MPKGYIATGRRYYGQSSGILSGPAIKNAVEEGTIRIDPFNEDQLNPASYDLTLGKSATVYIRPWELDPTKPQETHRFEIPKEGLVVGPRTDILSGRDQRGFLLHTAERIWADCFVPVIDGKSSLGRLFLSVHQTAGYGDPGFDGQYTLEVVSIYPVRLYVGMRIAQVRFHSILGEIAHYNGNYRGDNATGPVPSMAWKQSIK